MHARSLLGFLLLIDTAVLMLMEMLGPIQAKIGRQAKELMRSPQNRRSGVIVTLMDTATIKQSEQI